MVKKLLLTQMCVIFYSQTTAQLFTEIDSGIHGVNQGNVIWGDYDNDGDLDIVISGSIDSSPAGGITKIYNNTGNGFVEVYPGKISGIIGSAVAWGDFDSDGDLDLAIGGEDAERWIIMRLTLKFLKT